MFCVYTEVTVQDDIVVSKIDENRCKQILANLP